jgi:hypothetical protein
MLLSRKMLRSTRTRAAPLDFLFADNVAEEMASNMGAASTTPYVPPEVGPSIFVGSAVALVPIVWATYEFANRIRVQQECLVCNGSGLISFTKRNTPLNRQRKCYNCGGFLPWLGWKAFFLSSFTDVGNGGALQRPARDYDANNAAIVLQRQTQKQQQQQQQVEADDDGGEEMVLRR